MKKSRINQILKDSELIKTAKDKGFEGLFSTTNSVIGNINTGIGKMRGWHINTKTLVEDFRFNQILKDRKKQVSKDNKISSHLLSKGDFAAISGLLVEKFKHFTGVKIKKGFISLTIFA